MFRKFLNLTLLLLIVSLIAPIINRRNINTLKSLYNSSVQKIFPFKEKVQICHSLQRNIQGVLSDSIEKWSITILNTDGYITSDINGSIPRIPASNLKLITTAYALDMLGPHSRFKTSLYYSGKGEYSLFGSGDPDFSITHLNSFIKNINAHSKSKDLNKLSINLYEESRDRWWPNSWSINDRYESYGAPITRLALSSNSGTYSYQYPLSMLKQSIISKVQKQLVFTKRDPSHSPDLSSLLPKRSLKLNEYHSAPVYALLGLANSESHNFTSEVLLRNSSGTWDNNLATKRVQDWMKTKPIPTNGLFVKDGSGLSRSNRITTRTISYLLYNMDKHKDSKFYISSLSILGIRGTLKTFDGLEYLNGKFYGKTGTLNGVRSISGYLNTKQGYLYISLIYNGEGEVDHKISSILKSVYINRNCNY